MATNFLIGEQHRDGVDGKSLLRVTSDPNRPWDILWLTVHNSPFGLTPKQARALANALRLWAAKR